MIKFIMATVPGNCPGAKRLLSSLSLREVGEAEALGRRDPGAERGVLGRRGASGSARGADSRVQPEERAVLSMGCGPSQPDGEQKCVRAPRKGWEEGFKVKQTNQA